MTSLLELCGEFVLQGNGISLENFLALRDLSLLLEKSEIRLKVDQFLWKHFRKIRDSEEFLAVPCEYLKEILDSPKLKVDREMEVVETILRWVQREPGREEHLEQLMDSVRLHVLEDAELLNIADRVQDRHEKFARKIRDTVWQRGRSVAEATDDYQKANIGETAEVFAQKEPRRSTAGILVASEGVFALLSVLQFRNDTARLSNMRQHGSPRG